MRWMKGISIIVPALMLLAACGGSDGGPKKPSDIHLDYQVGQTMVLEMQGFGISWEWYRDGVRLTSSPKISMTGRSLTVRNLDMVDSGAYWATYMDRGERHTTNKAFVTVNHVPVVLRALPELMEVVMGETATLVAPVERGSALSYQWYRDASALPGETGAELSVVVSEDTLARYSVLVSNPVSEIHSTEVQFVTVEQYATGYWWTRKGTVYSDVVVKPNGEFWMVIEDTRVSDPYVLFQRGEVSTWSGSWSVAPSPGRSSIFYWQTPSLSYGNLVLSDGTIEQKQTLAGRFAYLGVNEVLNHSYQNSIVSRQIEMSDLTGAWSHPDLALVIQADGTLGTGSFVLTSACGLQGAVERVEDTEYLYRLSANISAGSPACSYGAYRVNGVGTFTPGPTGLDFTILYGVDHATTGETLVGLRSSLRR